MTRKRQALLSWVDPQNVKHVINAPWVQWKADIKKSTIHFTGKFLYPIVLNSFSLFVAYNSLTLDWVILVDIIIA